MSAKSKNSHSVREVLRSIAQFEPSQNATSVQLGQSVEKSKLQEGLAYLSIKVERQ